MQSHRISMLGTGLIGDFYTMTLHGQRGRDRVGVVYSRSEEEDEPSASGGGCPGRPPRWKRRSTMPRPMWW